MPSNHLGPRVLYVDDDEDSREMLRMLLELRSIETKAVDKKMGHQAGATAYVIKHDVSHLLGVLTFESPVSLDPLAPEPEVTKPRAEGAKDEQHAEGYKKNGKPQNEK